MIDDGLALLRSLFGREYFEVAQDAPITLSVPTSPTAIIGNYPYKWVLSYLIKVRSLGDASYVAIGSQTSQEFRLTIIGETFGFSANPREAFDLSKVYVKSDMTATAPVIEIVMTYVPIPYQGSVSLAQTRGLGE